MRLSLFRENHEKQEFALLNATVAIGEFSFVLAAVGKQSGITEDYDYQMFQETGA